MLRNLAASTCITLRRPMSADAGTALLSSYFVALDFEPTGEARPNALSRFVQHEFEELLFEHVYSTGMTGLITRSAAMIDKDARNFYFICVILAGSLRVGQRREVIDLHAGDIMVFDSAQPYTIHFADYEKKEALYIKVPGARLDSRLRPRSSLIGSKIDGSCGLGKIVAQMLRTALREARTIEYLQASRLIEAAFDLLATASAPDDTVAQASAKRERRWTTIRRIQDYIEENLGDEDLSRESIALHHKISVRYLSRLFENEGVSLSQWILARRLEMARQRLATRDGAPGSITELAFDCGFRNVSHFNRTFKERFGCTPKSLRRT
jgi:AraC family transcriptional regulator, positive regulator of tynA and feaB